MHDRVVPVQFLLGPAGSGKTFRCLAEIRTTLEAKASGRRLILLAPKQATFQLERQLVTGKELPGYTRLHILSFERLAEFVLDRCGAVVSPLLNEEGRSMVLRALLTQASAEMTVFRATARLPGFAGQVGEIMRELEQHGATPERLRQLAAELDPRQRLRGKLFDLATLWARYRGWLEGRRLEDSAHLLSLAREVLEAFSGAKPQSTRERAASEPADPGAVAGSRRIPGPGGLGAGSEQLDDAAWPWFSGLWLDGFAEMTPQELDLLAAVIPWCERAKLAFCVEESAWLPGDWLSPWGLVGKTQSELRARLSRLPGLAVTTQRLPLRGAPTRFSGNPALAHLERAWANPHPYTPPHDAIGRELPLRVLRCANLEAEAVAAARVILDFVREDQGRFRDTAVLVRSLEAYQGIVRRVFARYGLPAFLDRRESAAHHPLAELTRSSLRLAAFNWQTEDWLGVLKTGLLCDDENTIDALENAALAEGWQGETWLQPLPATPQWADSPKFEPLRQRLVPPFADFIRQLAAEGGAPTGGQLAGSLRQLWNRLGVGTTLQAWSEGSRADHSASRTSSSVTEPGGPMRAPAVADPGNEAQEILPSGANALHATVWQDLNTLLDNLEQAFATQSLPVRDWLPILEAGLANLTVGVVPPALDQVLVGAIDRSRNPDLKLVVLLGWNDGVFPGPIPLPPMLTEAERRELELRGMALGPDRRRRIGRERYYAYIACTRARERVVVTFADRDEDDRALSPSPFLAHLRRLFPELVEERPPSQPGWGAIEHLTEAVVPWLRLRHETASSPAATSRPDLPALQRATDLLAAGANLDLRESLLPALADRLYGPGVLRTSVSRMERFAACPFQFFVHSGMRAEERRLFEVDVRQTGSFQHEVLARFHAALEAEGRPWRELEPAAARARLARIAEQLLGEFGNGLFWADARRRFAARALSRALQDFIEVVVTWMREAYGFDPVAAELAFGSAKDPLPAWSIDLEDGHSLQLRGKIDRVDLARTGTPDEALCVVVDYKSSARKIDPLLLEHGVQIQLPTYLAALRALAGGQPIFGIARLVPAGVFYVNLRGSYGRDANRADASSSRATARREAYRHRGRFNLAALPALDRQWNQPPGSGQFSYAPGGKPNRTYRDPLGADEFTGLLDQVEELLRRIGREVFGGKADVAPYVKGTAETACRVCLYQSVCRFDPWLHEHRRLRPAEPVA